MIRLVVVAVLLLTDLAAIFTEAKATAWRPCPRPKRSEWCCENIRLPSQTSASPGKFDLDEHAYLREILDAIDNPEVRRITFIGATQIGKTELEKAVILSQGEVARAPMMFAGPDQVYVREQRELLYRTAEASPSIRDHLPPARYRNDRWIDLEKCLVYQAWSGSTQRLSGRSCKVVLCSEVDRWQHSPLLAVERTKAFPDNSCVMFEGTPVGASTYLEDLYKQSDRRTYHVPCPKCGTYQELRFFVHKHDPYTGRGGVVALKDDAGNWRSPNQARKAARYCCLNGCLIDEVDHPEMVRKGRWIRDGEQIDGVGRITGEPTNPGRHWGYRGNSLLAKTFGDAAEMYLSVRDTTDGLERFFNDWLGLGFVARGKTPRWRDLGERLAAQHPRGSVPRQAYFITAAADVQARGVYWVARAWGHGKSSWLVDFGFLPKSATIPIDEDSDELGEEQLASDLAQLDGAVLQRHFPILGENALGKSQLAARLLGLDCGYRPTDVYAYVRARPGKRVLPVRGDPKIVPGTLYRPSKVERNARTGRVYPEGLEAWGIDTNAYKSEIADRWQADRTQPGVWWLPRDILTTKGGEDYLRQITSETRTIEPRYGRRIVRWELLSKGQDNHYWDCEVYACCLADMITGSIWDAAQWQQWQPRPQRQREEQMAAAATERWSSSDDFSAR